MRCAQCDWCDAHDSNENGIYCMIGWPMPEIRDGRCDHFNPECESDIWKFHSVKKEDAAAFREQLLKWKDGGEAPGR